MADEIAIADDFYDLRRERVELNAARNTMRADFWDDPRMLPQVARIARGEEWLQLIDEALHEIERRYA